MLWVVVVDGPVQGRELIPVYVLEEAGSGVTGGGVAEGERGLIGWTSQQHWRTNSPQDLLQTAVAGWNRAPVEGAVTLDGKSCH